ncbi:inositol monophosphatase [Corynebacterium hindlerae]|uniref:Inositol-1-monophosphatase n=2 Tax=Corynebacterium hindlerae TaxID=699041 RepID=A0A7G5FFQ6_9CORY|nr:inositol monophosphatase family protein [Corynebacterium hindlerae]QMV85447.1 inositol monophosphatase [Corynebacterium hindlerae]QTH58672.1 inositol monophosphatase [Corynebacterium hindlerae]
MKAMTTHLAALKDVAEQVALEAATAIRNKRAELGDIAGYTQTKSTPVDPVTVVDTYAEEVIAQRLRQLRPDDGLVGEEGSDTAGTSGVTWIVDPIDGTVNFVYGIPQFAVSIAAAMDGEVIAGAVINVSTGELFSAAKGQGAMVQRDGGTEQLACNSVTDPAKALLATGFGYSAARRAQQAQFVAKLLPQVRDIRRMGSAALDLCAVASGQVDAHLEHGLNAWDYAAGALIAAEAGAEVHVPPLSSSGALGELVFVAAPGIFDQLWEIVAQAGGTEPFRVH